MYSLIVVPLSNRFLVTLFLYKKKLFTINPRKPKSSMSASIGTRFDAGWYTGKNMGSSYTPFFVMSLSAGMVLCLFPAVYSASSGYAAAHVVNGGNNQVSGVFQHLHQVFKNIRGNVFLRGPDVAP